MKIAILGGAGLMGAGIVRDLSSDRAIVPISAIRVADVSRARIDALSAELGDSRLAAFELDVNNPARLADAVSGVDIVINAVPTLLGHQMAIFEACLAAGGKKVAHMEGGFAAWKAAGLPYMGTEMATGAPKKMGG